jgi:hypothetical protein
MPSPQEADRYIGKQLSLEVIKAERGTARYNSQLGLNVEHHHSRFGLREGTVKLVDLNAGLADVNANLHYYGLRKGSQPHGVKVRYYPTKKYERGVAVLLDTKDTVGGKFVVGAYGMAHDLERRLNTYETANPNARISRQYQIETIRKEIRAVSSDDKIYAAASVAHTQSAQDTGTFGRSGLRDTHGQFLNDPQYSDFADINSSFTTTSDGAHPTEASYKIVAKLIAQKITKESEWALGKLKGNPDIELPSNAQMGICTKCKKPGHDIDANNCKWCGTKL